MRQPPGRPGRPSSSLSPPRRHLWGWSLREGVVPWASMPSWLGWGAGPLWGSHARSTLGKGLYNGRQGVLLGQLELMQPSALSCPGSHKELSHHVSKPVTLYPGRIESAADEELQPQAAQKQLSPGFNLFNACKTSFMHV